MAEHAGEIGQLAGGTREQVLELLRRASLTVEELAFELDLTPNAVRAQLTALERDDLVCRVGKRPGVRKPSILYGLTEEAERSFSRAYGPVLAELIHVLTERLDARALREVMQRVGERLAANEMRGVASGRRSSPGTDAEFEARLERAIQFIQALGGSVESQDNGGVVEICSHGCLLADTTRDHDVACTALERLLQMVIGTRVQEHCDRAEKPRCRFTVPRP